MAEKIYTQQFGEVQNKSVCTTTDDLKFDNFTECGTYHIYEDKGDGCSCTYYLFVDKSANGQTTQTRVHCGKVEYRKQNADGTWTAWSASTGGDVPENVCAWGGSVSSVDEFPENPTAGTVCIAGTDFATNAYKYTGVVNELFDCWNEETGIWLVRTLFYAPNDCRIYEDVGFGEEEIVKICNSNGYDADYVHADVPKGYPMHTTLDKLGASDVTDTVTIYLPLANGDSWEDVNIFREGAMLMFDGEKWNSYPSTKETGDISAALDAIIRIQNNLIGGASV